MLNRQIPTHKFINLSEPANQGENVKLIKRVSVPSTHYYLNDSRTNLVQSCVVVSLIQKERNTFFCYQRVMSNELKWNIFWFSPLTRRTSVRDESSEWADGAMIIKTSCFYVQTRHPKNSVSVQCFCMRELLLLLVSNENLRWLDIVLSTVAVMQ